MVARRAALEDDLAASAEVEGLDFGEALDADSFHKLKALLGRLTSLASSRTAIYREMRELDDRLGLTPKGMAALRWQIIADPEVETSATDDEVAQKRDDRRTRLNAS